MNIHPSNNNIFAIALKVCVHVLFLTYLSFSMQNSNISIVDFKNKKQSILEFHTKPVSCIAFSENVMASIGTDKYYISLFSFLLYSHNYSKICIWDCVEDKTSKFSAMQFTARCNLEYRNRPPKCAQFDPGAKNLLFVQDDCLCISYICTDMRYSTLFF